MNPFIMRLIDANANRAREGLRVLEDYARFILDHQPISAGLKQLRHDLTVALKPIEPDAVLCRDTTGDVGLSSKTHTELIRQDLAQVVIAAGKRLGEALRAMEEFAKIDHPDTAAALESIRYQFYDLEQRLIRTLRPAHRLAKAQLCVLITESACRSDWFDTAAAAIAGGADMLQLREKELPARQVLQRAKRFVKLCRDHDVISIINDRLDIALLSQADGVHVGQDDLPAAEVRKLLGRDKIVGLSTHCIEQARQAATDGADYIGIGPFFYSSTKPRPFIAGPDYARQVAAEISLPAFAIAGITQENLDEVLASGITRIAVTAAVSGAEDACAAARQLKSRLNVAQA
ncbi:MAG: thiamine phosphate synthase [Phycisphaerales bacterium]|nr:thiamine phosphate synthase [Phycisphaerales bacterium]